MSYTVNPFELTPAQQAYLGQQLGEVSRSFALVMPFLETPLRHYLAIAYLLCRVVDNIEDCGQPHPWQEERYVEFLLLLREPGQATAVLSLWEGETWPALTERERLLMGVTDGRPLWEMYAQLPQAAQNVVQHWTGEMARGMRQLGNPDRRPYFVERQGVTVIAAETDYDDYCYYVAGTVGHMASELAIRQYQLAEKTAQALRPHAEACGRGLQKTNIVKDFAEDLTRGICYLPDAWLAAAEYAPLDLQGAPPAWKAMVLADVLDELRTATAYLLALPYSAVGYRRASLLCLLPAYQTILLAAQRQEILFTPDHQIKISRLTMAQCVVDSQVMLSDNKAIRQYGERIEDKIRSQFGQQVADGVDRS